MRWLIINADDYGLCEASNEAVERLFDAGAITSATLMVPAPKAEDGLRRARANPRMHIGLHITTTCEYDNYRWGPILPEMKSLVAQDGGFYKTACENLAHAHPEEMERELRAQSDWMAQRGLAPEHVDSHMATVYGLHGFSCMDAALHLCHEHGLGFRFPRIPQTFSGTLPEPVLQIMREGIAKAEAWQVNIPNGLFTYDFDVSSDMKYEDFRGAYMDMVRRCPQGVSELFMHPCIETQQLKEINRHWKKRVWEYQVLLDTVFRECIVREGICLTTYAKAPPEAWNVEKS